MLTFQGKNAVHRSSDGILINGQFGTRNLFMLIELNYVQSNLDFVAVKLQNVLTTKSKVLRVGCSLDCF